MNSEVFVKLTETAENININKISEIVEEIKQKIEQSQICNVAFVLGSYDIIVLSELLSEFGINSSGYQDFISVDYKPYIVNVHYEDDNSFLVFDEYIGEKVCSRIEIKTNSEQFKNFSIAFICNIGFDSIDESFLYRFSYLVFLTNATMAMNLTEKTWINDTVVPQFGTERMTICLYNTNLLNSEDDAKAVEKNVNKIISNNDWKCRCIYDVNMLPDTITDIVSKREELETKRIRQILKNGISEIKNFANGILEVNNIDTDKLSGMVERLNSERKKVEISAKIAVENKVENMFDDLKYQIVNAADNYFNDAYTSIYNRLSTTKDVFSDTKHIPSYFENVCRYFETKASEKIVADYGKIAEELAEVIESDCKKIANIISIPGFELFSAGMTTPIDCMLTNTFSTDHAEDTLRKAKNFSKGTLVASVALAFVNPALGLSALIGSRVYGHYKVKETENETRKVILESLQSDCAEIKKNVIANINSEMENIQKTTAENLNNVYKKVLDSLVNVILETVAKVEESKKESEKISELLNVTIPDIEDIL